MNLLEGMKANNTVTNTKGGLYFDTTYNANLDLFSKVSRFNSEDEIISIFKSALEENQDMALANLLYILDIRNGKGERRIFKIIFKYLCENNKECALKILSFISDLGRYDYILEGLNTLIHDDVIDLIKKQLDEDIKCDYPSLLAKWLPSHRSHNVNNLNAKIIIKSLNIFEKEYRMMLSALRTKIKIVEKDLSSKNYDNIDFKKVPTKAMLKYSNLFYKELGDRFSEFKQQVISGEVKINTEGLFSYEVVRKYLKHTADEEILELMWNNQKDVLSNTNSNILVMADTSGSMTCQDCLPLATALGLALYTAERNSGIFKNHFMTFSRIPYLCEIKGNTLAEKISNIPTYVENTNIDLAFKLLLDSAIDNELKQEDLPSHIIIVSDMEFDRGVYSKESTNFKGWKKTFEAAGYQLPRIVFWNVAAYTQGVPVTKFDNDVVMISGFSTNLFSNVLNLDEFTPERLMYETLKNYLNLLNEKKDI